MKQSTKNFIGDVAKAACAIGVVALCRKFGVKTSFTIGDAARAVDRTFPTAQPTIGVRWPKPETTLEQRMLTIAKSGYKNTLACDRYEVAKKIFDRAREVGVSRHEKDFAAELLNIYADRAKLACDRNEIIDMILDLWE